VSVDTLIVPKITGLTPQVPFTHGTWTHVENLPLADPSYHLPGHIDLFLGADMFSSLVLTGQQKWENGEPMAMETIFGWVLVGPIESSASGSLNSFCILSLKTSTTLKRNFGNLKNDKPFIISVERTLLQRSSINRLQLALSQDGPWLNFPSSHSAPY